MPTQEQPDVGPTQQRAAPAAGLRRASFRLGDQLPDLATELVAALEARAEPELAAAVPNLTIVARCDCGDPYCATMYTVPPPRGWWGPQYRTINLDAEAGYLIVGALGPRIVEVSVLFREDVRRQLLSLLP
jgi:hypothetical protein